MSSWFSLYSFLIHLTSSCGFVWHWCCIIVFCMWLCISHIFSFFGSELQNAISPSILHKFPWNLTCELLHMLSRCLHHETLQYYTISVSCFWQLRGNFQGQTALLAVIYYRVTQNFASTSYWMVFRCSKFVAVLLHVWNIYLSTHCESLEGCMIMWTLCDLEHQTENEVHHMLEGRCMSWSEICLSVFQHCITMKITITRT